MHVHDRLNAWLRAADLSGSELARLLGVHRSYVSHLRTGRAIPSLAVAAEIERRSAAWSDGPIYCREWVRPVSAPAKAEPAAEAAPAEEAAPLAATG